MENIVGKKYGELTVIEDMGSFIKPNTKHRKHYVKCKDPSGHMGIYRYSDIKTGHTKSGRKQRNIKDEKDLNTYMIVYQVGDMVLSIDVKAESIRQLTSRVDSGQDFFLHVNEDTSINPSCILKIDILKRAKK